MPLTDHTPPSDIILSAPNNDRDLLYQSERTRIFRLRLPQSGGSVIVKEPLGPAAREKLRHETDILGSLTHVRQISQLSGTQVPGATLVLDDRGGESLAQIIARERLETSHILKIAIQLASTVAEIHHAGIAHKDINPTNILLIGQERMPLLIDFDHATSLSEERPPFVHHSQITGNLAYLAPEQTGRVGWALDQRADLYGLGATLYEIATGNLPFPEADPLALIHQILTKSPTPPSALVPNLPDLLSKIIMRLLEKEPDLRYQSADGLVHDLTRLQKMLSSSGVQTFDLGKRDFPLRFRPPSRLFGRDGELATLRSTVDRICSGQGAVLLVSGASGAGKSALIDELRAMVTTRHGWYASGKFDQFRHDRKSGASAQALRHLGRLLLAENEAGLRLYRSRILNAIGSNAGLISASFPEFAIILGIAPETDSGDPLEALSRLHQASLKLLRTIASPDHPLVLVVDDLQWANQETITFIDNLLAEGGIPGLMLVGAYRDNEIDANHPLALKLQAWDRLASPPHQMHLRNLPSADLTLLLEDVLRLPTQAAFELSEVIAQRTDGNPFDTMELLNALRSGCMLTLEKEGWSWDSSAIRQFVGHHEIADLLAARIAQLAEETGQQLRLMACLGGEADLDLLSAAADLPAMEVLRRLNPALEEGLLMLEQGQLGLTDTRSIVVRFRHDRVQKAVHDCLEPTLRIQLHLMLGRRLAQHTLYGYPAAEQYLEALDWLDTPHERRSVADLFRAAAAGARLNANFATVERFLAEAMEIYRCLGAREDDPALATLETEWHAALCCLARFEQADQVYLSIRKRCRDPLERVNATCVQINSLSNRDRQQEAVTLGLELLRELGIPSPQQLDREIEQGLESLYSWIAVHTPEGELQRREADNPLVVGAGKLLQRMMGPAFFYDPLLSAWLVLTSQRLWAEHGPCPALLAGLGGTPVVMAALCNDYRTGYLMTRLALRVGEVRAYEPETSWVRHCFALFCSHWHEPLEESIGQAQLARQGLLNSGDLQYTCFTFHTSLAALLDSAASLSLFETELEAALAFARHTGNAFSLPSFLAYEQLLKALRGTTNLPGSFDDSDFNEVDYLLNTVATPLATATFHIYRALSAALFGDAPALARHAAAAMPFLPHIQGFYPTVLAHLLQALALAERIRLGEPRERATLLAELDACVSWLRSRADDAPANFQHLLKLVEAERAWALGDLWEAAATFDVALREAGQRQRPWHRALLTERAALFHMSHGLEHTGRILLTETLQLYQGWGACGKVRQLENRYHFPQSTSDSRPHQTPERSSAVSNDSIDLLAILRTSQALSSETSLQRLIQRVTNLLEAMTGATSVRLIIRSNEMQEWSVMDPDEEGVSSLPLEEAADQGLLPLSVVRYVERTLEPLLVDDANQDCRFARDPYLEGLERCSLLAVPILSQGSARALLLLENRLALQAFSIDRLDAAKLIAGQLAVSLDNALLYDSLEQKVTERTAELEEEVVARRSAEELYRTLVEHSPDGILIVNPSTLQIVRFNSRAHLQLGYTSEELARLTILDLEDGDTSSLTETHFHNLADGGDARFETIHRTNLGDARTVLVHAKTIQLSGQVMAHCIFRDITDSRRMAEELLKIRKLESISVLAGGMAHDFNNLLTAILGNISMAQMLTPPETKLHKLLINAEKASQRASALTNQLLTFAKGGAPIKRAIALEELIRTCIDSSVRRATVRCELAIPAGLWPCQVDEGQITQVFNNLISNADQAMPDGGLVLIRAENLVAAQDCSLPLAAGAYLKIDIQDQGEGIPREQHASIFDPYFTTRQDRVGLGLTTTYSIVKRHGGLITVESEPGAGTCVTLYLPAMAAPIPRESIVESPLARRGGKILLMDDQEMILDIAETMLISLGYEVVRTTDGSQAIAAYRSAMETGHPFYAVIMDLTVPGGMGGREAVLRLREIDPQVKAIVSSGYCNDPVLADFEQHGFVGMLSKPYRREELIQLLAGL
ncbi:MAG: AAA family ATPase [Desulfuromonadales bacterium]|nr:AAA family ATPase [Desulfuromonadales bacterium]